MKSYRPAKAYTAKKTTRQQRGKVYFLPSTNELGETFYHFVLVNQQGQWLLNNLKNANTDMIHAFGEIVASHEGANPICNLKLQMEENRPN